jgi:hypothetical protein
LFNATTAEVIHLTQLERTIISAAIALQDMVIGKADIHTHTDIPDIAMLRAVMNIPVSGIIQSFHEPVYPFTLAAIHIIIIAVYSIVIIMVFTSLCMHRLAYAWAYSPTVIIPFTWEEFPIIIMKEYITVIMATTSTK